MGVKKVAAKKPPKLKELPDGAIQIPLTLGLGTTRASYEDLVKVLAVVQYLYNPDRIKAGKAVLAQLTQIQRAAVAALRNSGSY